MSEPTPSQALVLFGLLARHGECPQADLMPAVSKADREALVGAKLIGAAKVGRALALRLEDDGWAWAAAHLGAALPPPQRALQDLLARLGEHLETSGEILADFIGPKPAAPEGVVPKKPRSSEAAAARPRKAKAAAGADPKPKAAKPPTVAAMKKRVEGAYLAITGGRRNETVRLARLRDELGDLDRKTVDAALGRILKGEHRKVSLMRHDDPRQIDRADEAAAYSPAGEPFHLIWIEA